MTTTTTHLPAAGTGTTGAGHRPSGDPLLPVVGAGTLVPLVDGRHLPYANLDVAASAPALAAVADRVAAVLPLYASVHRGAGYLSQVSTALYEAARVAIGAFVDAREEDVTVVVRNTTDALNLLAGAVPAGPDGDPGRVLVLDVEHHANLLPWARGASTVIVAAPTLAETLDRLRTELARRPYALLAVTGASNVTGEALPLGEVVALAHDAGARVVLDGAQLVPHRRFSLAETDVDYVAYSGHKTYAPYGAGALVGRRDWLDAAPAYLSGGGAVAQVCVGRDEEPDAGTPAAGGATCEDDGCGTPGGHVDVRWQPAPARHEAGSPNVVGAVALAAACEALAGLAPEALADHEASLRIRLVAGLERIDGVTVARIWSDSADPIGVVAFTVAGHDPGLVAAYLSAEHGIGVRDGRFCAHPLLARLGFAGGGIRASVGASTSVGDVDRLVAGVAAYVADGPRADYAVVDGCWAVVDDPRPVPAGSGLEGLFATAAAGFVAAAAGCGAELG